MTNYRHLCDKCPDTYPHVEHTFCNGCYGRVPVPLGQRVIRNSQPFCDKCPAGSEGKKLKDMFDTEEVIITHDQELTEKMIEKFKEQK